MSIRRYLMIVCSVFLIMLSAIIALTWEPEKMAPGFYGRLALYLPFGAALMTLHITGYARKTPHDNRTGFLAYRQANQMLFGVVGLMVGCTVWALIKS